MAISKKSMISSTTKKSTTKSSPTASGPIAPASKLKTASGIAMGGKGLGFGK